MRMRVVVAMSGGVDSSVAAALVAEAGYEAVGITLKLLERLDTGFGCCGSPRDVEDARRVCERLGMPHYTLDLHDLFERKVISPFVETYLQARTPNPCVECNRHVKFRYLLALAQAWGAQKVATGHYARIDSVARASGVEGRASEEETLDPRPSTPEGFYRLLRAVDEAKDQSYFLYMLGQHELALTLFPVGELTKAQVREKARSLGLATADKRESQEICFVPNRDYRSFVAARTATPPEISKIQDPSNDRNHCADHAPRIANHASLPGDIVDTAGNVLGRHNGLGNYTVGQREGLRIATGRRLYVVGLDPEHNRLVVGSREEAYADSVIVSGVRWTRGVMPARAEIQVRYRARPVPARLQTMAHGWVRAALDEPQFAPAPGQSAVFYDGNEVLGGGVITATTAATQAKQAEKARGQQHC